MLGLNQQEASYITHANGCSSKWECCAVRECFTAGSWTCALVTRSLSRNKQHNDASLVGRMGMGKTTCTQGPNSSFRHYPTAEWPADFQIRILVNLGRAFLCFGSKSTKHPFPGQLVLY